MAINMNGGSFILGVLLIIVLALVLIGVSQIDGCEFNSNSTYSSTYNR